MVLNGLTFAVLVFAILPPGAYPRGIFAMFAIGGGYGGYLVSTRVGRKYRSFPVYYAVGSFVVAMTILIVAIATLADLIGSGVDFTA